MHRAMVTQAAAGAAALVTTIDSPWGPIHIAATTRGIVGVAWQAATDDVIADLERRLGEPVTLAGAARPEDRRRPILDRAAAEFERWLAGEPTAFDLPVDLSGMSAWDRAVLEGVRRIPWGRTESYGGVARLIGRAGAARAVGGAVSRNPVGVIVPCHRVIAGDGTIGGYGGDAWGSRETRLELKRALLALEGVVVPPASH
jgi:methylated-DNA-[protein]-cysteine S-methyltransferase